MTTHGGEEDDAFGLAVRNALAAKDAEIRRLKAKLLKTETALLEMTKLLVSR